jgi:hypothetical protein
MSYAMTMREMILTQDYAIALPGFFGISFLTRQHPLNFFPALTLLAAFVHCPMQLELIANIQIFLVRPLFSFTNSIVYQLEVFNV